MTGNKSTEALKLDSFCRLVTSTPKNNQVMHKCLLFDIVYIYLYIVYSQGRVSVRMLAWNKRFKTGLGDAFTDEGAVAFSQSLLDKNWLSQ